MDADFTVDGEPTFIDAFVVPEFNLNVADTNRIKHHFELKLNVEEVIREMNDDYQNWVEVAKADDEKMGEVQDELGEAGYPELSELVKIEKLVELVFGQYLFREVFQKCCDNPDEDSLYWHNRIESCRLEEGEIVLLGTCFSRS